jgi:hypothetical protein
LREDFLPERQGTYHARVFDAKAVAISKARMQQVDREQPILFQRGVPPLFAANRRQAVPVVSEGVQKFDVDLVEADIFPETFVVVADLGRQ